MNPISMLVVVVGVALVSGRFSQASRHSPRISPPSQRTSQAALSLLTTDRQLDSCGQLMEAYMSSLLAGNQHEVAIEAAAGVYEENYNAGGLASRLSIPCSAAEVAWKAAVAEGEDPLLPAALAYLQSSPPSHSPCDAAAREYFQAVATGATNIDAFLAAIKSFAGQIKKLADYGLPTIDSACLSTAQDYLATNQVSSSPLTSAMEAFVEKAVEIDVGYDPVCYAAADKFIESYISGKREDISLQIAAKEFLSLYFANPTVANRSPCAAAAKAYAEAAANGPNSTINKAMLAFIKEAEEKNHSGLDPVCTATGEAYFNAFLSGATEGAATKAAAIAFIEAVGSNPTFQMNSPCGKAAEAYIAEFY